jgi:hypothetical protein
MNAQTKDYMLLPSLRFLPGKEIQLGMLFLLDEAKRYPDPENPLNADRVLPLRAPLNEPVIIRDLDSTTTKQRNIQLNSGPTFPHWRVSAQVLRKAKTK